MEPLHPCKPCIPANPATLRRLIGTSAYSSSPLGRLLVPYPHCRGRQSVQAVRQTFISVKPRQGPDCTHRLPRSGAKQPQTIPTLEPCLDPELWNKRVLLDQHPSTQDDPRDCRSPLLSLEPPGPIQTNLNVRLSVCPALLGRSSVPTMQQQSQAGEQMPEMVHAKGP